MEGHGQKILSYILILTILTVSFAGCRVTARAESAPEEENTGKYVKEVFIAYGKTEADARAWLEANGWEPIAGENDFCAGKNSFYDSAVAAVMGIRRTDDVRAAVTDMAVMNMTGGYSLHDYESLLEQKKQDIDELIYRFMDVITEYRANYNGEGSAFGQKRAELAYRLLNKFYDGEPGAEGAANDTGLPLGELFLAQTRQEGSEDGGDLQQIILESSGAAMLAVEQLLSVGADAGEDTWLERLAGMSGDGLTENLERYVPEAAGQHLAPSAAVSYLNEYFGDTADLLAEQWTDIHEEMLWYENYTTENGLWQEDDESDEDYTARIEEYFEGLSEDPDESGAELEHYTSAMILYMSLYEVPYEGEWGETLADFFNPYDGTDYGRDADLFLPMAAVLSPGQRASLEFLSLYSLLMTGFGDEEALDAAAPKIDDLLKGAPELSVYTGVKRAAFRGGVAITNKALMDQNMGRGQAYDQIWEELGIMAITSYAAAFVGVSTFVAGAVMAAKGVEVVGKADPVYISQLENDLYWANSEMETYRMCLRSGWSEEIMETEGYKNAKLAYDKANEALKQAKSQGKTIPTKMGTAGRWMMGIGGALLVASAVVKGIQLYKYYQRTFVPIPRMIVDESDIVTYLTDDSGKPLLDEKGNQKKYIEFNTFEYYDAVKCNRPEVGEISDWQSGVSDYQNMGCYDIADLNGDFGQEWLALYTVKSERKGDPILADSMTLQYKSDEQPKGTTKSLHLFEYTYPVDLGDTAWSFNNDKGGVYFFWDEDAGAFDKTTASAFSGGQMAMAGAAGLLVGVIGATLVLLPKRRKKSII